MHYGQGINMLDLERESDSAEDVYRPDYNWIDIYSDGTIRSDKSNSPIEYLGTFHEKHKPEKVQAVDHFYYPELHFDTYYNDLIP